MLNILVALIYGIWWIYPCSILKNIQNFRIFVTPWGDYDGEYCVRPIQWDSKSGMVTYVNEVGSCEKNPFNMCISC